ncbi:hypothetical protein PVL29_002980 [Vitis rotundifolia]|uniref:Protein kinase domain-containing protein n=1 Tax=Vitis rotundifolia TaxID=103349 RepID=A0AA39E074_VITRO|nr:hypothetical protein PVL29_002980 [Vitis rotundifolia]
MGRNWVIFLLLVASGVVMASAAEVLVTQFSYNEFNEERDTGSFKLLVQASIDGGALQLTPDTANDDYSLTNKSGRIFWPKPFKLWDSNGDQEYGNLASFVSFFVINIYRQPSWNAGEGFAFVIAPNLTIPEASYGQWLGLTNATTDGDRTNQIVAVDVWVQYDGQAKVMEVYMGKEGDPKPSSPLLRDTIDLKHYVKQESYFGFAASTGYPAIELNCVLKWKLDMEILPGDKGFMWWLLSIPAVILILVVVGGIVYLNYKKRREGGNGKEGNVLGDLRRLTGMPREFRYKDLKKATKNFDESTKLGQGGFGVVYKGVLQEDGDDSTTEVAVKQFSRDDIKGKGDFMAELTIIHRLRHKHLVRLVGWCYEKGKLLLVYDFMPNGSLDKHLFGDHYDNTLNWERRYNILTGVGSALLYLHNEFDQKVVHRDLKGSNIMLDSTFNARLGDFGLARALDNGRSSYAELELGGFPGTMGYVAPECFHTQKATVESDVYAFGAVVLEVVCGRSPGSEIPYNQGLYSLIDWVWMLHREGRIVEAVDERLGNNYVDDEARRLLLLGLACSHPSASERPATLAIVQILSGSVSAPHVPPFKPAFTWASMVSLTTPTTTTSILSSTASLSP